MRICSFLPGATEIAFALGLGDQIVGVTHECDYPAEAKQKPVVVRSAIDSHRLSGHEIDRKVGELLEAGKGLYLIDDEALRASAPELILTQGLCDVCALDYNEVVKAAAGLTYVPIILSLNPHSLADVLDDVVRIGAATNSAAAADAFVSELRQRVEQIGLGEPNYRPRVVCLEWFEPLYIAGHWVPEMVALAGGHDVLGRLGEPSFRIEWSSVLDADPEIILLMPCGFDVRRAVKEASALRRLPRWEELPAVKGGRVYALNGSAYFSRPGPRLVNGLEILARIIHPETVAWSIPSADAAIIN
ncbi:MAG TPA: cobalamin-binding protein [Candidatus Binatia bacterium]|nr:cobalamin-binding protein [Candidatus Binatia bacterium]